MDNDQDQDQTPQTDPTWTNAPEAEPAMPAASASATSSDQPSTWDNVKAAGSTLLGAVPDAIEIAGGLGSESCKAIAETVPALSSAAGVYHGIMDSDSQSDARLDAQVNENDPDRVQADNDKDAFYGQRKEYDTASAIPAVGTFLAAGEIGAGVTNWAQGGQGGFEGGEDSWKNTVEDGIDMMGGGNPIKGGASGTPVAQPGWGANQALQDKYEDEAAQQGVPK
jgi:hypothetical protein